ncbi:MAG: hypothetical protein IMZ52_09600 [Actinobacteria bacterium]|nr:hypothetical protein [Bacteroidota bacterium]MBE3095272.1 hypothetical protein [Actinomycetota bacterium]
MTKKLKGLFAFIFIIVAVIVSVSIPSIVVHEGIHYIMYTTEGINVTSFHILDWSGLEMGCVGYVTVEEDSRYGDIFQEGLAYFVQCLFIMLLSSLCLNTIFKSFIQRQLNLICSDLPATVHILP